MLDRLTNLNLDFSLAAWAPGPTPIFLFLLALALDAVLGPLLRRLPLPHPDMLVAALTLWLERRLNRDKRSPATRLVRGLILVALLLAFGGAFAVAVSFAATKLPFGWILALAVLLSLITQNRPFGAARGAAHKVAGKPGAGGKELDIQTPVLTARKTSKGFSKDPHAVARGAVEHLAGRFSEGLIAESFWFVLLGLPGIILYRIINVCGEVLDEALPRREQFGFVATRLNEAVTFLPVRLAALLLSLAALFVAGARPLRALATMSGSGRGLASRGIAWPVAAAAGALDLSLAGPPLATGGPGRKGRWVGPKDGRARATALDVHRGLFLYTVGCFLNVVLLLLIVIASSLI
jgi:adenosylcobinamide-phosphate synthase